MDRTDFEILRHLQNDGRISNKTLANRVNLAPSTCSERVRHLNDSGVIQGTHAEVAPEALGVGLEAMYMLGLTKHSRELVENFQADIMRLDEVRATYLVSGRYDFMVHVAVRDVDHLRNLALDAFTSRPEVTRIETVLIFDHRRNHELPGYAEPA